MFRKYMVKKGGYLSGNDGKMRFFGWQVQNEIRHLIQSCKKIDRTLDFYKKDRMILRCWLF